MTLNRKKLLFAIAFPIVLLLGLTLQKHTLRQTGVKKVFPISGFDPRDLLSGHYLIYSVDYGIPDVCSVGSANWSKKTEAHICFDTGVFVNGPIRDSNCKVAIEGSCTGSRFVAGLERFYVPQEKALALEKLVQNRQASIVVSIGSRGEAQVTDLLIDGVPWQEALLAIPTPSPETSSAQ
ncbi:MAG: GDYXXLXY domain-containing protein [Deltaproteobacteria bacterium]|jgi:uncharacterized membrane-anchored protein|nr:GDYXXLXY domain-containing protein [Deltaproteobacteria bacterium]